MKLFIFAVILISIISFSGFDNSVIAEYDSEPNDLVVHEWGTFTSIAGKNGVALDWRPLNGASDLPTFVYRENGENGFRGTYQEKCSGKDQKLVKVRMETPVIYFYTKKESEVEVSVSFPKGRITEWYPQAGIVNNYAGNNQRDELISNRINWGKIKLLPDEKPEFLRETADSHYYPARETDAVPVQVCNADKTKIEKEKFLFYRGVGNFGLPLKTGLSGGKVVLDLVPLWNDNSKNLATKLTDLLVFENRGGRVGYQFVPSLTKLTTLERPILDKSLEQVFSELENLLTAQGLYEKESKAMIETWKDSWFEEGLRVFYALPTAATDEILPLRVMPKPRETVRVLVGRAEIITPEMERDVRRQIGFLRSKSSFVRAEAQNYLQKYGRFYEPILRSLRQTERDPKVRRQINVLLKLS